MLSRALEYIIVLFPRERERTRGSERGTGAGEIKEKEKERESARERECSQAGLVVIGSFVRRHPKHAGP